MGLNAIVYTHYNNIKLDRECDYDVIRVDEYTGEVYIDSGDYSSRYAQEKFICVKKRLGNLSHVAHIRKNLQKILDQHASLLLGKVLYSGFHSGDIIALNDIEQLEDEINSIEKAIQSQGSNDLVEFLYDMKELVRAAQEQRNPIVFV